MTVSSPRHNTTKPTILLDMDGTILDLAFDNYFWQTHTMNHFAKLNNITVEEANAILVPKINSTKGTLEWYCIDYWSEQLGFSIADLKSAIADQVSLREGSIQFLQWLKDHQYPCWLATNAHPDTLAIKFNQVKISGYFDHLISSHDIGYPKEHPKFWTELHKQFPFNKQHAVFVDDTLSVLQAAQSYGIGSNYRVIQPDSGQDKAHCDEFAMINTLDELIPILREQHG